MVAKVRRVNAHVHVRTRILAFETGLAGAVTRGEFSRCWRIARLMRDCSKEMGKKEQMKEPSAAKGERHYT